MVIMTGLKVVGIGGMPDFASGIGAPVEEVPTSRLISSLSSSSCSCSVALDPVGA